MFECRYQGARHFVSPAVSAHLEELRRGSKAPYKFLRKDDVHSFVLVCAVNASKHLRDAVYTEIARDSKWRSVAPRSSLRPSSIELCTLPLVQETRRSLCKLYGDVSWTPIPLGGA